MLFLVPLKMIYIITLLSSISHDKYNVILMHDTKNKTVEALPMIIDYAKSNGYTFKSIDINTMPLMQKSK